MKTRGPWIIMLHLTMKNQYFSLPSAANNNFHCVFSLASWFCRQFILIVKMKFHPQKWSDSRYFLICMSMRLSSTNPPCLVFLLYQYLMGKNYDFWCNLCDFEKPEVHEFQWNRLTKLITNMPKHLKSSVQIHNYDIKPSKSF